MRTKTLALSSLLGAIGAASAVAQTNVYSINAVGYINLVLPVGFSQIGIQLTNSSGPNTVKSIFPNPQGGPGTYNNCVVEKYNPGTGHYQSESGSTSYSANGWTGGGTMSLNPGEAVWFNNGTGVPITNTIVGTVPQGTFTVNIVPGFQLISSPVPFSGDIVTNMGFTNFIVGSVFEVYNPAGHNYNTYASTSSGGTGYMNEWVPGDPQAGVGQGFWYNSDASPTPWVQTFEINP
jgi:hypothetical protein